MSKFFAIKSVRISAILFGVAMLYGAAGFWLAPKLLRSALIEDIPGETGAIPSVGAIRINPFLLQLEVRDFALSAQSGDRLFGFGRLFVDVGLASVWRRALVFKNIEIEAPFVNAVVASDGALNLAQLKPKSPPPPPKATEAPKSLPRIQISEFRVAQGILSYEDRSVPSQFTTRLEPIAFDLRDFSTDAQGGMFTLTGASKLGEHFELHGHLAVQPIESDGELRIEGLRAQTIWTYAEDRVGFAVDSGQLDLDLHYRFALRSAVELQVELAKAALRDLSVRPKGAAADSGKDNEWIVAPELVVTNGSFDLGARAVHVDTLALTGKGARLAERGPIVEPGHARGPSGRVRASRRGPSPGCRCRRSCAAVERTTAPIRAARRDDFPAGSHHQPGRQDDDRTAVADGQRCDSRYDARGSDQPGCEAQ